jgi:uncharacterized membrane protein SpoIIM required for sporulation
MISNQWLAKRKKHWERLEALVSQTAKDGYKSLTRQELRELAFLYRQTAADLSTAREDASSQQIARYLNQLLGRAHNIIYSGRKSRASHLLRFFSEEYPRVFRQNAGYVYAAFAMFLIGAVLGAVLTLIRPQFMHEFLGPGMVATIERREMWTHSVVSIKPIASSEIMTNNMTVSFTTFALGITAGLGTIYMEVFNGLMLGIISMACAMAGMGGQLWTFVVAHGALELPAIFIAGGAGLRIATALLFPGPYSRKDSLLTGGAQAVRLMVGTIPMLIVAGIVEGFISPSAIAAPVKFALGGSLFFLLVLYLSSGRRQPARAASPGIGDAITAGSAL